jgi:hypothetical protein
VASDLGLRHYAPSCIVPRCWSSHPTVAVFRIFTLVAIVCAIIGESAHAQMGRFGAGRGGGQGQPQTQTQTQTEASPPPPAIIPEVWPRLDPGALFCKTESDLIRYQTELAGRQASRAAAPPKCRMIEETTGIIILDRPNLSRTKVELSATSNQVGWTDAFLPATPPGP